MITNDAIRQYRRAGVYVTEYYGLSTDTKPTDCGNGSKFFEMDTGKMYLFDETGGRWLEWGASA